MQFVIRVVAGSFPYPDLGPGGSELAGYIPAEIPWKQLNYGQGEGQVEIDHCEWGFYQTGFGELTIALHMGECLATTAFDLVRRVAELTCGDRPFEIVLRGMERKT